MPNSARDAAFRGSPDTPRCESCGRVPTLPVVVRKAAFLPIVRLYSKSGGPISLCKMCGLEMFHSMQKRSGATIATGNFIYGPYVMAQNEKWIVRLKRLADPVDPTAS